MRHTPIHRSAHALALIAYLLGSLLATWPLAAHFTTHVTGDGIDDPALAWNLWWIKHRLVDQLQPDIFHSGWLFHPIQINLGFYTLTPLNGLISVPIQTAMTLTIANNLILLSSFVLGGYGVWLLVQTVWAHHFSSSKRWIGWSIAWLAGAFYAFAGAKLFYASLGQFNIASSQWLPFCALYVWRALHSHTRRAAWRNGLMAGLFLVFQAWAELTYATFLLLFFALAYLYYSLRWLISQRSEIIRWLRATQGMIAAALLFVIGIAPFLAAILPDMRLEGDFFASGGGFADIYSADLMGYLVPTRLHPLLGTWAATLPFPNDKGQQIYLGYILMLLVVLGMVAGLRRQRERTTTLFWIIAFVFFWLLTLGPLLRWSGENLAMPGPFALVSQLPFFNGNRYPSRYSVMLLLCAALLAAHGLLWLTARSWLRARQSHALLILALVGLLFTAEQISTPLPLSDFRIPPIYRRLAAEAGDFAVLELPTGWRNGARVLGKSDLLIMMQQWYQTAHSKRRLGGNTSRNPAYKFQYFSETPLLGDLIALMNADRPHLASLMEEDYPMIAAHARASAAELFDLLDVRYVTLHLERSPALLVRLVEEALPVTLIEEWHGPDWTGAPSTIRLYAVDKSPAPSERTIDLAAPGAQMYLAEGWSPVGSAQQGRYATRASVDLLLPAWSSGARITLTYAQPSTVTYHYQGHSLGQQSGTMHTLTLPALVERVPTPRLTLTFDSAPTPITTLVPAATPIGSTGVNLAPGLAILAQSAGEEVGDFAHIWINGLEYAANERGYNLVALTPGGEILGQAIFDTFDVEKSDESERMAAWLESWERGTILVGAAADTVADEAGNALNETAIAALRQFGVAGDLRGKFRWSHAFVGVAGAMPATALEEIQLTHPAAVWLGVPLPAASGYGPLQRFTLTAAP
ncbi:MAG: hypothetical protein IT328_18760 [Caldilineaceae bacterium]|nr:hypothetical protein [Caldilineaceae bacterium]